MEVIGFLGFVGLLVCVMAVVAAAFFAGRTSDD